MKQLSMYVEATGVRRPQCAVKWQSQTSTGGCYRGIEWHHHTRSVNGCHLEFDLDGNLKFGVLNSAINLFVCRCVDNILAHAIRLDGHLCSIHYHNRDCGCHHICGYG